MTGVKYGTADGPVTITVLKRDHGGSISVHNHGPELPELGREALFHPFARGASSERGHQARGLGLALVRACADAHGGSVAVRSGPGEGTTFTMQLPSRDA